MIKKKIKVSVHIRKKQQFENYRFQTFLRLSYLLHPISLNLNKFETDTPTEECVCVFGFNVTFNNFSVISRRCLVATGSSLL